MVHSGDMTSPPVSYKHRFPPQIIAHAVWLYFRFPLSLRLVEEMLLERGIVLTYETIHRWAMKFGLDYARRLKRKKPGRRDVWHLDEVVVSINGEKRYLWRAVDQDGYILDEIVQVRRHAKAAQRLPKRLLHKQGCRPRRMVTDKLGSYAAARRKIMPGVEHQSHKGLNNRAENSHVPLRKRERAIQGFKSWRCNVLSTFSPHSATSSSHPNLIARVGSWPTVGLLARCSFGQRPDG
jgi:putative transposase